MKLTGRGVWFYPDGLTSDGVVDFAKRIEAMGYTALWLPEAGGRDPFALAARLLDHTSQLVVATGIANIYARDAAAMKAAQYTLAEQSGTVSSWELACLTAFSSRTCAGIPMAPPARCDAHVS